MVRSFEGIETRRLLGVQVHAASMNQVIAACRTAMSERRPLSIGVVNAAKVVRMRRDPALRDAVLASDVVLADGMGVVWASRVLGCPLPERVAGIDLFVRLLSLAEAEGLSVFFLGARQDVLDRTLDGVRARHPALRIAGSRNGYFRSDEEEAVAAAIAAAHPDLLFVGISSPRKELFLSRFGAILGATVSHGVGGSFDVLAGDLRRAPPRWQRAGVEWLYRLLQEPRRLWQRYLVTNTLFVGMVLREWARGRAGGEEGRVGVDGEAVNPIAPPGGSGPQEYAPPRRKPRL